MLLDSNIIIYAINESSPKHKLAQEFIVKNKSKLYVAQQNIFETLRILTHPKYPKPMNITDAIDTVQGICDALTVISPQQETYILALELIKKYGLTSDQVFDAYLLATMLSNEIRDIVTDNEKDFKGFEGIKILNPFKS